MTAKKLDSVLRAHDGSRLEKIVRRAQKMDDLLAALRAGLPPDLAAELRAANLHDDGELVVLCSTPAWAARLRFEDRRLIEAARGIGAQAMTLRVRVSR